MKEKTAGDNGNQDRFQVKVGEEIACVEIVSVKNKIYAVEFPGKEPLFITQIRDKNNRIAWISIPQGHDDIAQLIGEAIGKRKKTI